MTDTEHRSWVDESAGAWTARCLCGWTGKRRRIKITIDAPTRHHASTRAEEAAWEDGERHEEEAAAGPVPPVPGRGK